VKANYLKIIVQIMSITFKNVRIIQVNYITWAILSMNFKYFGMYGELYIDFQEINKAISKF